MTTGYAGQAINSVLNSKMGFCKFLSANDTGATGGHQSGILISKSAVRMLFTSQELEQAGKYNVFTISWCHRDFGHWYIREQAHGDIQYSSVYADKRVCNLSGYICREA